MSTTMITVMSATPQIARPAEIEVHTVTEALALGAQGKLLFCSNCAHCKVIKVFDRFRAGQLRVQKTERRIVCEQGHWGGRTFKLRFAHRRTMAACPDYASMGEDDRLEFVETLAGNADG